MNLHQVFIIQLLVGALLATLVVVTAYALKMLTVGGAAAAFVLGVVVFGLGGFSWAVVLIVFFTFSSGLSRLFKRQKNKAEKEYAKGSRRDAGQVFANGGVAGVFTILHFIYPQSILPWIGFCAALAAANADTWATELGVLNRSNPVLIINRKSVEPGTSGAISVVGTLAAAVGALLIGGVTFIVWPAELDSSANIWMTCLVFLAGLIGSLIDSLLGATLQAVYYCPACKKESEKHPLHNCGAQTTLIRGQPWLNNDWVNLFCTLSSSLIALFIIGLGKFH